MDSVVLQCSSVRKNQDNLGILQKDHSQNVMYRTLLIELLSLKHTKMHVSSQHAVALAIYSLHDLLHSFTMDSILSDLN